jgi:hypothetical protein
MRRTALPDIQRSLRTIMPATSLDRRTALIVVDLQKGIVSVPAVHPLASVV